jgi:hypothetical protein
MACINTQKKSKQQKKLKFRAARAPESVCKGKKSLHQQGGIMIKNTIVILACSVLIATVAFAQPRSTQERQTSTATEQPITVTGTTITAIEEGSAANYQPVKTLVIREDRSNSPGKYVLNGPGHVVNKNGEVIRTAIKPGTRVRVFYVNMGDLRMVDHVVVD